MRRLASCACVLLIGIAAGCRDDSTSPTTTTTTTTATTTASASATASASTPAEAAIAPQVLTEPSPESEPPPELEPESPAAEPEEVDAETLEAMLGNTLEQNSPFGQLAELDTGIRCAPMTPNEFGTIGEGSMRPKDPASSVRFKSVVTAGPDEHVVRRIARAHINEIRACYDQVLRRKQDAAGLVTLSLTLSEGGHVSKASATGFDSQLEDCVERRARTWVFPADTSPGTAEVPIDLRVE